MHIKKLLVGTVVVVALVAAVGYSLRAPLSVAIAGRVVAISMAQDASNTLPDGLHVGLCGAGSPLPDDARTGPCTLVLAGKRLFVFDVGSSASRNIGKMGFNQGRIEAVFLTHFHSDHIDGLGELMLQRWVSDSNTAPVAVHGPQGVDRIVAGFMQAYAQDQGSRVLHHGEKTLPGSGFGGSAIAFTLGADGRAVLLKDADLEIAAFEVDHGPVKPAVGYRISYKGRSVVISGDTKKSAAVQREAQGIDLLVHEAMSTPLMGILQDSAAQAVRPRLHQLLLDIQNYHSTPQEAAEVARDAKARYLLLHHIAPPLPLPGLVKAFLGNAPEIYSGPIRVGSDGDFVSLPAGSRDIDTSWRF